MILLRRLLGDVLREHRREQGRTLREVSAAARVSLGYLSEVERGQKEASSELLGVDAALLARKGPVDPDVAVAMAAGVRHRLGATWGLGTTGVAGPDPQDGHPPGVCFVALAGPDGTRVQALALDGDRAAVRAAAVAAALALLHAALTGGNASR